MAGRSAIRMAIAYDFDGTLAPGNMQDRNFIPAIQLKPARFWKDVKAFAKRHDADEILAYMHLMLERADRAEVQVREADFRAFGRQLRLFPGLPQWFPRMTRIAKRHGVTLEHYVISSGLREMIAGTKINRYIKRVFASGFQYDHHGVAKWPAVAMNYTTKTQFLFRINKGIQNTYDNAQINEWMPEEKRRIPFRNMIYIGDGDTDIPCMKMVKHQGGHAIAVFQSRKHGGRKRAMSLLLEDRADYVFAADYRDGSLVSRAVADLIQMIAADTRLRRAGKPRPKPR